MQALYDLFDQIQKQEEKIENYTLHLYFGVVAVLPAIRLHERNIEHLSVQIDVMMAETMSMAQLLEAEQYAHGREIPHIIMAAVEKRICADCQNINNKLSYAQIKRRLADFSEWLAVFRRFTNSMWDDHSAKYRFKVYEAQEKLEDLLFKRKQDMALATMMATHTRLGKNALLHQLALEPALLRQITDHF
jgi:hypothetical protein